VALATVMLYGLSFSLLRVPYSVLLALMAFPFEFVPLIGPPIAFGIILLVVFLGGYHHLMWLVVIFFGVRIIEDYVLQPYLMGSGGIELSPLVVILVAGVPGLLLSVPAIATVRLLCHHLTKLGSPSPEFLRESLADSV
jgi:predicted PurR-regulated permease PerM